MALDATKTINGTYGTVYENGNWLTNFNEAEAKVEIEKSEIKRAGTRWVGYKVVGLKGSGKIKGFKITSEFNSKISQVVDDEKGTQYTTELIFKLADPESYGSERIRIKNVSFNTIPLIGYKVGEVCEEELDFNFEGFEYLDTIVADE